MRWTKLALVLAAAVAAGCLDTSGASVEPTPDAGEPPDAAVPPLPAQDVSVDFGTSAVGESVERRITIRNDGASPLEVTEVQHGTRFDDAFSAQFAPMTIAPGERAEIALAFKPLQPGPRLADLVFLMRGGPAPQLVAHLKGTGLELGYSVEPSGGADFGTAIVGEVRTRRIQVLNGSDADWSVTVGALQGSVDAFEFGPGFSAGRYTVVAHGALAIPVVFKPSATGTFVAMFSVATALPGSASVIGLSGAAVDQAITWEPQAIAFGYINVGQRVQTKVTLRNAADTDVTISRLSVAGPPNDGELFRLETTDRLFTLRGGEEREFMVSFAPLAVGVVGGSLTFETDAGLPSSGTILLSGFGGGPNLDARAKLEFGEVPTGVFQYRSLTVANAGTDLPGTLDDNLFFAIRDASGHWAPRPPELTSVTGEFTIEPLTLPATGLAAGEKVAYRVKFAPTTAGQRQATLTIYSNDPDEPQKVVTILGDAVSLPPCILDIVPAQLDFGTVETGRSLTLNLQLRNRGANECRVSQLELAPGTATEFGLVNGPIENKTILAGATFAVPVRFAPTAAGDFLGTMRFYTSSTAMPEASVALAAKSAANCLLASVPAVDFGLIQTACSSPERSVVITNLCSATATIDDVALLAGTSPEVTITQKPPVPLTVATNGSFEVKLRYRPIDAGVDASALTITSGQLKRVLPVSGTSSATGMQRDEFIQEAYPRVDVLFVVDDSCSMSDKQTSLANNFPSFIQAATARHVDYHIAVTTVSVDAPGTSYANGRFLPLTATPPRVLTPTTPNVAQVFAQTVQVGTNGAGNEMLIRPAYLALTPPNIQTDNAGFLRSDANLAVIIVSDAADQDTTPLSNYRNFLAGLKSADRKVTVSGFIPTQATEPPYSSGCSYDSSDAGTSMRARDLISQTGGVFEEICSSSWAAGLGRIGDAAFGGPRTRFALSSARDVAVPMTVEVDGQPYAQMDPSGETRWTFDSASNCIDFAAAYRPAVGAQIAVNYKVACIP